jgi:hypothetical protein
MLGVATSNPANDMDIRLSCLLFCAASVLFIGPVVIQRSPTGCLCLSQLCDVETSSRKRSKKELDCGYTKKKLYLL